MADDAYDVSDVAAPTDSENTHAVYVDDVDDNGDNGENGAERDGESGEGVSRSSQILDSVGQFLSERVQRLKEVAFDDAETSDEVDIKDLIAEYEKNTEGHGRLLHLFKEHVHLVQRMQWTQHKMAMYFKDRSTRETDDVIQGALEDAADAYDNLQFLYDAFTNQMKVSVGALESLASIVGDDMNESIKKHKKARLTYDTAKSKVQRLNEKVANGKDVDPAKLRAAEDNARTLREKLLVVNDALREKLPMHLDHRRQKIPIVLKGNLRAMEALYNINAQDDE